MWLSVSAWLGDTLIDARLVPPHGSYRIGKAAGVDLPWVGATDFPLVGPGGVVNRLPGMAADGDLVLGLVRVRIERVPAPRERVGRPGYGDRRVRGYLGASAVVQVGAVIAVLAGVAPAATPLMVAPKVSLHAATWKTRVVAPGVVEPAPAPQHVTAMSSRQAIAAIAAAWRGGGSGGDVKLTGAARAAYEQSSGAAVASGFAGMVFGVMGKLSNAEMKQLVDDAVYWNPDEGSEATEGFGGTRRKFDPSAKLSVAKTGRYATVGHGHAAGDDYDLPTPPRLEMCGGRGCVATGPTPTAVIAGVLGERSGSIGACGKGLRAPTTVYVSFEIAADGTVAHARGTSALGSCVADVVATTTFPAAGDATRVRYPVTFRPAAG